ncbi:hypothetical protein FRB90_010736 [Tulasnella sp. 427]|nr:hypothetical protein FRB90_010736 [Tulasnella sp. 427]
MSTISESVKKLSTTLLPSLGPALADHLPCGEQNLETRIAAFNDLVELWEDVHRRAEVLKSVRDNTHDLERRIEDLRCRLQCVKDDTLKPESPAHVKRFTGGLASQIPFADVNAFRMSVAGGVNSLDRLAVSANEFDAELQVAKEDATGLESNMSRHRTPFNQMASATSLAELGLRMQELKEIRDHTIGDLPARLCRRLSQLSQAILALESVPGAHDPVAHESIVIADLSERDLVLVSANGVANSKTSVMHHKEAVEATLLEDSTARSTLEYLATVVNELKTQHEQTVASQLPVLQPLGLLPKPLKHFRTSSLQPLLTPAVDRAAVSESDASRLNPQFAKPKDQISQRLQLVDAGHWVNEEADTVLKELSAFGTMENRTATACLSVPSARSESSPIELQAGAQNHLKEVNGRLAPRISDL